MTAEADLCQPALERDNRGPGLRSRRHLLTCYLPLLGFLGVTAWAAADFVLPPRPATTVSVCGTQSEARRQGTPLFKAVGWVEPRPAPVQVATLAPGIVDKLLVVEDQFVKAGEAVAELVKDDARLAYERSLADLKLREAELEEAQVLLAAATTRLEQPVHLEALLAEAEVALAKIESQVESAPFEIRRAEAQFELAKRNYEGKSALKGVVAGRAIDEARSALTTATASLEDLQAQKAPLRKEQKALVAHRDALKTLFELKAGELKAKRETEAKLKVAQARVAQARVVLAEVKLHLDRMTVRAPVDGRVLHLVAQPGTKLIEGRDCTEPLDGSTVVTMYRPRRLQVRVDVRFEDIPKVSSGQPVRIESPAVPEPIEGRVLFIGSLPDTESNTLQVKVAIDSPPSVFKPGMLVDVTLLAPRKADQKSAPRQAGDASATRVRRPRRVFLAVGDALSNQPLSARGT